MTIIDQNTRPTARTPHLGSMVNQALQAATTVPATLRAILTPLSINPEKELAKAARREAARRATNYLMR